MTKKRKVGKYRERKSGVKSLPHDIAGMVVEFHGLHARVYIPQHTAHISTGGQDLTIVHEATAGQITRVCAEFTRHLDGAFSRSEIVDRAHVVETSAGDQVAGRCVSTCHDPRRPQRDGIHLVGCVSIPNNQLAVL